MWLFLETLFLRKINNHISRFHICLSKKIKHQFQEILIDTYYTYMFVCVFTRAKDMIMQAIHFLCYLFSTKLKKKLLKEERIIFSYFKFGKDRKEKKKFLFSFFDPILKIVQQQQQQK